MSSKKFPEKYLCSEMVNISQESVNKIIAL